MSTRGGVSACPWRQPPCEGARRLTHGEAGEIAACLLNGPAKVGVVDDVVPAEDGRGPVAGNLSSDIRIDPGHTNKVWPKRPTRRTKSISQTWR